MTCEFPNCRFQVAHPGAKYCHGHLRFMGSGSPESKDSPKRAVSGRDFPKAKAKPGPKKGARKAKKTASGAISKRSRKMKAMIVELRKAVAAFLQEPGNQVCHILSPVCTRVATTVNHRRGRIGSLLLDRRWFQACCAACNNYIEQHDAWAREHGHKLSRLVKL